MMERIEQQDALIEQLNSRLNGIIDGQSTQSKSLSYIYSKNLTYK